MRNLVLGVFILAVGLCTAQGTLAQTTGPRIPPLVIRSLAGADLFAAYCATCHGKNGKGKGTVVPALKVAPPDLTLIARRNGGTFPHERIEDFVTNGTKNPAPTHGTKDMPVWGPVFLGLDPSPALARVRVANIVKYIESIQAR